MSDSFHVLLTGATGLVGARIYRLFPPGVRVTPLLHRRQLPGGLRPGDGALEADLAVPGEGRRAVAQVAPDVVIHAAAVSRLGDAQSDPAAAWRLNVEATEEIARACREAGAWLLHFSTDQVFDGEAAPYGEQDPTDPLTAYGRSKAEAERRVLEADPRALVLRCALVLGPSPDGRSGAVDFLREAARTGKEVRAFTDEVRTPISILDLWRTVAVLLELRPAGLLHVAGSEAVDRQVLALGVRDAFGLRRLRLTPGSRAEADHPRPRDLSLRTERARRLGLPRCPPLAQALAELADLALQERLPDDLRTSL